MNDQKEMKIKSDMREPACGEHEVKKETTYRTPKSFTDTTGAAYKKLNNPTLYVGDRVRYCGQYGHVSRIHPGVIEDVSYCVTVRFDDNTLLNVMIDPIENISSGSDCRQAKKVQFTSAELKHKAKKKKTKKTSAT